MAKDAQKKRKKRKSKETLEHEKLELEIQELRKKRRFGIWATAIAGIVIAIGGISTLGIQAWQHRSTLRNQSKQHLREMRELAMGRTTENITTLLLELGALHPQKRYTAAAGLEIYLYRDGYKDYQEDIRKAIGELINMEIDNGVKTKLIYITAKQRGLGATINVAQAGKIRAGKPKEEVRKEVIELVEKGVVGLDLSGQDLSGIDFSNINLILANLKGANLNGANFEGADLNGSLLNEAKLNKAQLAGASLGYADLSNADLYKANMSNASLRDAYLAMANLTDAILDDADLLGANLKNADLRNASLRGTTLDRANLSNANLEGVKNFNSAFLRGTLLANVKGLSKEELQYARSQGAIFEENRFYEQIPQQMQQQMIQQRPLPTEELKPLPLLRSEELERQLREQTQEH